ncbi:MAG: PAS domain S-box protein [Haloarculaceae archaeon]
MSEDEEGSGPSREPDVGSDVVTAAAGEASAVPGGSVRLDGERRVTGVDDALLSLSGYDRTDLLGRHVSTLFEAADEARLEDAISRLDGASRARATTALAVRTAGGETVPVSVRVEAAEADAQAVRCVVGAVAADGQSTDARGVAGGGSSGPADVGHRVEQTLSRICETTDWAYADAWAPDDDGRLRLVTAVGATDAVGGSEGDGPRFAVGEGVVGRVYASGEPEWVVDADSDEAFGRREAAADAGFRTAIGVPITDGEEVLAVLTFLTSDRREPDEELLSFVSAMAVQLGDVLVDYREREHQWRDREQFAEMVDAVEDYAIFMLDAEGHVTTWNRGAAQIKGYDAGEILGEHFRQFYTPKDREARRPERNLAAAAEQGRIEDEGWRLRADGSRFWANVTITAVRDDDGQLLGYTKVTRDMTQRREYERTLRRERDLLEGVLDATPVGIAVVDADGQIVRTNTFSRERFGIGEGGVDSIAEAPLYDEDGTELPAEDRPSTRVFETGEPIYDRRLAIETPTGDRRSLSVNAVPLGEGDEIDRVVVSYEDVTQLEAQARRLERERESLESELDDVFSRVTDAFFALDEDWRFTFVNDRAAELLEAQPGELVGANVWEAFSPAVDTTFEERYRHAMANQEPVAFEEYYPPLGTWFEVRAYPSETGLSVYFRDVTERKERERELAESERRYRTLAEYFPNGVVTLFDDDLVYQLAAGQGFDRIPVEPADLEGRRFDDAWDDETADALRPAFEAALAGEERTIELTYAGREWRLHAVPITDERGEVFAGMTMAQDVTEQRERERALAETTAQLEAATEAASVGTWEWDLREDRFVAGSWLARQFGIDPAAAAEGVSIDRMLASIHEADRERVEAAIDDAIERCGEYECEYRVRDESGDVRWVVARGSVECEGDEPVRFPGALTDITDRKRFEETLEALHETTRTLFRTEDRDRVAEAVVDAARDVIDLPGVGVFLADEDGETLSPAAVWTAEGLIGDVDLGPVPVADESPLGRSYATGEAIAVGDVRSEMDVDDEGFDLRGTVFVPLGEHGVLVVGSQDPGAVDEQTRRLVELLAANTQVALDRLDRERELRQYEHALETVDDGIYVLDGDERFVLVNDAYCELVGHDREELLGRSARDVISETGASEAEAVVESFERGDREPITVEATLERPDGSEFPTEATVTAIELGDGEVGRAGVVRDVTEQKRRERELERYETIVETANDGIYTVDKDGRFTLVNRAYAAMVGREPADLLGEHAADVVEPELHERARELGEQLERGEAERTSLEATITRPDGSTIEAEATFALAAEGDERERVAVVRDITDRKRFEETLESLHETTRTLFRAEDRDAIADTIVDTATGDLDLGGVAVYLRDDDVGDLYPASQSTGAVFMREGGLPRMPADDSSITGRVYGAGEVARFDDVRDSPHLQDEGTGMRSGLFVPLGEHGVVIVGSETVGAPDGQTRRLVELLAENARTALDRLDRERALEESRRRYETLVEHFPNGSVTLFDRDLRVILSGGESFKHFEYGPDDIRGVQLGDALSAEEAEQLLPRYEAALDGETSTFELEMGDQIFQFYVLPVRDEHGDVFAGLVMNQNVTTERKRERELQTRVRQQEVVTRLGQEALGTEDLDELFDRTAELLTETLETDYCEILDLEPEADELLLRAGVGWRDGAVGEATVPTEEGSQTGYTLLTDDPVVVEDLGAETRFTRPDLLSSHGVESGITVIVGPVADPWGVLGVHDTEPGTFSEQDVTFVQSVANILATAIDRTEHEQAILRQRERLAALNDLNGVVRDINEALVRQSTREEVENVVCERLAAAESYEFAWIGTLDSASDVVDVRTEAGVEGYLDDIEITVGPDGPMGPTARALRTGEMQVSQFSQDDPTLEPWREHVAEYGYRASAAIPIAYENTIYGVLNVYADRPDAFGGEERAVIAGLGEMIGHTINAIERKRFLMSDEVIEVELRIEDVFEMLDLDVEPGGEITLSQTIPLGDEEYVVYGSATGDGRETLDALVESLKHWDSVRDIGEQRFELKLSEPPVTSLIAGHGGRVRRATIEGGTYHMTVELPPDAAVREVVDGVKSAYPETEVLAQRQTSASGRVPGRYGFDLAEILTDRQLSALEAAYYAGFFEWPRESTGQDVAESLGVSAPTFHQHLRAAERRILEAVVEGREAEA